MSPDLLYCSRGHFVGFKDGTHKQSQILSLHPGRHIYLYCEKNSTDNTLESLTLGSDAQIDIIVECCTCDLARGGFTSKYLDYYRWLQSRLQIIDGLKIDFFLNDKRARLFADQSPCIPVYSNITHRFYGGRKGNISLYRFPRLGAFEVLLFWRYRPDEDWEEALLFSKLGTGSWPNLQRLTRHVERICGRKSHILRHI